ncbi:hypothetical protein ACMYYO_07370 [Dermacoccaceae bacterium W4C1]
MSGLSARSRWWRTALTAVVAGGAVLGTLGANDRSWPFAPMTMFAFSVQNDGQVTSRGIDAVTVTGRTVHVPLGDGGIGLERAEIEGQAATLRANPHRLQGIAVAAAGTHPGAERYAEVRLVNTISQLRDGKVISSRKVIEARWRVVDPQHPKDLP